MAVEKGDFTSVKFFLEDASIYFNMDINCIDALGRTALHIGWKALTFPVLFFFLLYFFLNVISVLNVFKYMKIFEKYYTVYNYYTVYKR